MEAQFEELQSTHKIIDSLKATKLESKIARAELSMKAADLEEELALEKEQFLKLEGVSAGLKWANKELEARVSSLSA